MSDADVCSVRPGDELDWDRIERHVRTEVDGLVGEMVVEQFAHGAANLTYLLRFGDRELVLRRPPFGALAPGSHDMRREFRVLSRLWEVYDRAPRAFLFCEGPSVAGADFFVMERRTGVVVRGEIPEEMRHHADVGRRVGEAFVDAVADLHLVDPASCGLEGLGRPDGFLVRQLDGWRSRWELAAPPEPHPVMDEVGKQLAAEVPTASRVSVLHNDLHFGNCQFDPGSPDRVTAIFDWDMATLGDPLVDLGGMLAYWRDDTPPSSASSDISPRLGVPTKAEVVERYAAKTGIDVGDIDWYHAFGRWKVAIIMQQLHGRYLRGESNNERLATMGENVAPLAEAAHELLAQR